MNLPEGLAREILRVAKVRRHYEDIGEAGELGLTLIDIALEGGCLAAGSNDIPAMIAALESLKTFES